MARATATSRLREPFTAAMRTRARRELLALALVAVGTFGVAHRTDIFEHLFRWSRAWEWAEFDELMVAIIVTAFAL